MMTTMITFTSLGMGGPHRANVLLDTVRRLDTTYMITRGSSRRSRPPCQMPPATRWLCCARPPTSAPDTRCAGRRRRRLAILAAPCSQTWTHELRARDGVRMLDLLRPRPRAAATLKTWRRRDRLGAVARSTGAPTSCTDCSQGRRLHLLSLGSARKFVDRADDALPAKIGAR
jgi:hypothetical protein